MYTPHIISRLSYKIKMACKEPKIVLTYKLLGSRKFHPIKRFKLLQHNTFPLLIT